MSQEKSDFIVTLPSMGEGVQEATLNKWLKKVGDKVEKDEPLLEVSTDKVDTEIMSPYSGYLIETFAKPEMVIKVEDNIAQISLTKTAPVLKILEESPSASKQTSPRKASQRKSRNTNPEMQVGTRQFSNMPKSYAGSIKSSPLVRKMAEDFAVPLGEIRGTGEYGRITKDDLLRYLDENSSSQKKEESSSLESFSLKTEKKEGKEFLEGVEITREPMSKIRRLTADHMLKSVRTSPHVTTTFEINLDPILIYKKEHSEAFEKKHKVKLTLTAFFIKACVKALKEHPYVNSSIDGYDILLKEDINIACAVATKAGLLVPVLKKLQDKSFGDIVSQFQSLVTKTRDKKLEPSDLMGGSFSITNPGMYGSLHSQPIINQPQVAILSVGAMTTRCQILQGKPTNQNFCQIGLTFDHRVIDGQGGAFFLKTVKEELENFS